MDTWLSELFDEEMCKTAALEAELEKMSVSELLAVIEGDLEKVANPYVNYALRRAGMGAAVGGVGGGALGAALDSEDRLRGLGRGAAMGAAAGGAYGGLSALGRLGGAAVGDRLVRNAPTLDSALNRSIGSSLAGHAVGLGAGIYGGAQAAKAVGGALNKKDRKKEGKESVKPGKSTTKDFVGTLKRNPNSQDLDTAFSAYEAETGKSRNAMSQKDINEYLDKTKVGFVVKLAHSLARTHYEIQKEAGIVGQPSLSERLKKIDAERRADPELQKRRAARIKDMKANPHRYFLRGNAG